MLKLKVIIASTRPGRVGPAVAEWFVERAKAHGAFDVELVDLAEVDLPVFDEPEHPAAQKYQNEHTKKWSAVVDSADAFVIVTPEYNYGTPPSLVNALTYLYNEWNYKPAGFVSYGGISGGLRSAQMTKLILNTLKVVPLTEAVTLPLVWNQLSEAGAFVPNDANAEAADGMLDELQKWAEALKPMRA
jgi:NAD(P)H-dependent FMN reductase